jgi:hypothetical protein
MSLHSDVDRGLALVAQIEAAKRELKLIEGRLFAAGLRGEQIQLNDPEREGRQFIAQGTTAAVPVIFEADLLIGSFAPDSDTHHTLRTLAGARLLHIYRDVRKFERLNPTGKGFRTLTRDTFDPPTAAAVIEASLARDKNGIPRSRMSVDWERAS